MKYIASKLSFDQTFDVYAGGNAPRSRVRRVTVRGRSNVRDPHTLVMPEGVITELSDEDAEIVAKHPLYRQYEKNGMMKLTTSKVGARSAKGDLAAKDGAAQLTEADYKKAGRKAPKAVRKSADDDDDSDDGDAAEK